MDAGTAIVLEIASVLATLLPHTPFATTDNVPEVKDAMSTVIVFDNPVEPEASVYPEGSVQV